MPTLFWWMVVAHFALDYPLQGDTTAREKNRHSTTALQGFVPWYYWMAAHALMQGGAVACITGSVPLGVAETVAHFLIDFGKCDNWYSIHVDQALHMACKVVWVAIHCGIVV